MSTETKSHAMLTAIQAELQAGRIEAAADQLEQAVLAGLSTENSDWWHVRAVVAYHQSRLEEAVDHWRCAIRQDARPHHRHNLAIALCDQATLLVERHELGLASAALEEAVRMAPQLAEAQAALGIVATEMQQWTLADQSLREAVRLDDTQARFHDALGILAQRRQRWTDAAAHHVAAIQRNARDAESWNNLGHALVQLGSGDKAVSALEQALAIKTDFAEAHNNLGNAHRDCGRFATAISHYVKALELKPTLTEAQFNLADLHRYQPGDAELARLLQTPLPDHPPSAALLWFARGKAFDDLGQADDAFECWQRGNRLIRSANGYDEARTLKSLEQLRTGLEDSARPPPNPNPPPAIPNHVFVVGAPRCGSTLLEQILTSHPSVAGFGERDFFEQSILRASPQVENHHDAWLGWTDEEVRSISQSYSSAARGALSGSADASLIVDKFLANALYLGGIHRALPAAKIIALFRDNRDVGLSCFSKRFGAGHPYAYDLAELGRYLSAHDRLLEAACRHLPEGTIMRVQYEQLIEDPEKIIRQILGFLGLDWDPRCLEFHTTDRIVTTASAQAVRKPINRRGIGRWRRYERHLGALLSSVGT